MQNHDDFSKIVEIGTEAVEPLTDILDNGDWDLRMKAAGALVKIGDSQVVSSLIAWLEEPDEYVQIFAAGLLSESGDSQAIEPILNLLENENAGFKTHEAAFASLVKLEKPLLSELEPLLSALAPICSEADEWPGLASLETPVPAEFYPVIVLDEDGQVAAGWTAIFLQKWEPIFPGDDLLIACLDQHYSKFETCWYMGAGAIERYDNQLKIKIRQTDTGLEIGSEHFNGDHPQCLLSRSHGDPHDKYYEEIKVKDIEAWLNQFTP